KVMTYNVQYLAGKEHVFFYDVPDLSGPDSRPTPASSARALEAIASLINAEDPDIVLLQELDHGARRTDYRDQLPLLLARLRGPYACSAEAFYWKAPFVPYPKIWGAVGLKLATLTKAGPARAVRRNLPSDFGNPLISLFGAQRAVLEVRVPVEGAGDLVIMNTHLEAFSAGTDLCARQIAQLDRLLTALDREGVPWVAGGDLNVLPPGQYAHLIPSHQTYYNQATEMAVLYDHHAVLPSLAAVTGPEGSKSYTYFGNDPALPGPDRTLDYLLHSPRLRLVESSVRQAGAETASDHFPVVAVFEIV
ncbi:MAG TPA: endonuclease/exonuclease/phosphatase family protein, partial [Anaerolineales bacterium]|nr:endonuclease/exonuclease/phosphatase family protein [Anaerolineales bacterium]